MARILLNWELGGHLGHLTRLAGLAEELYQRGHSITFALRELHAVESILGTNSPHCVLQAPIFLPTINTSRNPITYTEILQCNGYLTSQSLRYMVKAWQALTDFVNPDLIIYEYAPTAILANRGLNIPKIEVGTGFFIPPKESPIPPVRDEKKLSLRQRQASDEQVIKVINQVLPHSHTIKHIYDLFDGTLQLLTSFPELDCFQKRQNGQYVGPMSGRTTGKKADWPQSQKNSRSSHLQTSPSRIFAYLKPSYAKIKELMIALSQTGADIRAYIPDCPIELKTEYKSEKFQISTRPYSMDEVLGETDFTICHAGHDTTVHSLLAGTPILLIPQYVEQLEVARRVENIHAGIIVYSNEELAAIKNKIATLSNDKHYRANAKQFAERYQHMSVERCIEAVSDECERLIEQHS